MLRHPIPYRATGRFSPIVVDHVVGSPELRAFLSFTPDRTGLAAAMAARRFDPGLRATLCSVLEDQYAGVAVDKAVRENLDALGREGTLTVTTGHQLCLFTGPLYVPFKILNTLRLARELSTTDKRVVPIFWMATEDHDREEIDHAWLGDQKVQWPGDPAGAVGRLELKGITPVIPLAERLDIVGAIRYVDEAVVEDVPHKLEMWERLKFDVIIKGDDWRGTDKGDKLEADFAEVGVEVAYLPYTQRTSSSFLREVLQAVLEK